MTSYASVLTLGLLFISRILCGQTPASFGLPVLHEYPLNNARYVSPATTIGVRIGAAFSSGEDADIRIRLQGSRSGQVPCSYRLTRDKHMLLITPTRSFAVDENVDVEISAVLASGAHFSHQLRFHTGTTEPEPVRQTLGRPGEIKELASPQDSGANSLPVFRIISDKDPTPGRLFLANLGFGPLKNGYFLMVLDEHGSILKKKRVRGACGDFKVQMDGRWTYCDFSVPRCYEVDSNLAVIDSFRVANGYQPDIHELLTLGDRRYIVLILGTARLPLADYDLGRSDTALLLWNGIQEFDADGNLIVEWRGIDHYSILDSPHENWRDTSLHVFDFMHANSLCILRDGNILLSSRHLDELTKIDRVTGNILWRLGGRNNQFSFANDSIQFNYQHATRELPNGHITLFDNGNWHMPAESRAVEYELNEASHTATKVWEYRHDPPIASAAMGYVERLKNGNTLISWGGLPGADEWQTVTEVDPVNSVVFDMSMMAGNFSYRVIKDEIAVATVSNGPALQGDLRQEGGAVICPAVTQNPILFRVFDELGRELQRLTAYPEAATARVQIADLKLPSGEYWITATDDARQLGSMGFVVGAVR